MKMITKALVASGIAAGAVLAVPVAANAATYVPGNPTVYNVTVAPGGTFNLVINNGTFVDNAPLSISISGPGAVPTDATAAVFHSATATASGTANAAGGTTISGTIPAAATGTISLTATDPEGDSATVAVNTGVATAATSTTGLATTGTYISLATVWGAVGLVALGGGVIAVRQATRKREQSTKA